MAADPAKRRATYDDLREVPANLIAELVDGEIYTQPRPASLHSRAASGLTEELGPPFNRGRGGPGGWIILYEPELHLGPNVLVPDLAGWRRERLPELPDVAYFELAPDWLCEILFPSTALYDKRTKLPLYAKHSVAHVWLADPIERSLEVLKLDGPSYRLEGVFGGDERARIAPFDAIEFDVGALWMR
jgi:Uma2 family endonuclease